MSDESSEHSHPWLDSCHIIGWQAALLASGGDHDDLLSELEVLITFARFCEFGAVEDAPRADRLEESRAAGVWSEIDQAEDAYLRLRREQRKRLRESARQLYDSIQQNFVLP